jgi:hypothetical protein
MSLRNLHVSAVLLAALLLAATPVGWTTFASCRMTRATGRAKARG